MFKLRSLAVTLAFAVVSSMGLVSISSADSTRFAPPVGEMNTQSNRIYLHLKVSFRFTSPNSYSYCAQKTAPKRWGFNIFVCPSNSAINTSLTISETNAYNTVCKKQVSATSIPNVFIRPYGNGGATMDPLPCEVEVGAWVPSSVLKTIGTGTATSVLILNQPVYVSFQNGTIPHVQPTSTKTYFDVSGLWGQVGGGDNPAFIKQLMPNGFYSVNITFPACSNTPNC